MPFVNGVAAYYAALDRRKGNPAEQCARGTTDEVLIADTGHEVDYSWRFGDLVASPLVVQLYAEFLDEVA